MADNAGTTRLESYYKLHAAIYDLSRWSFLFGRKEAIKGLPMLIKYPNEILEIGCGTGSNLSCLTKMYPMANFTGIDLSSEMLEKAARKKPIQNFKVNLIQANYLDFTADCKYDIIFLSYSLTMMGQYKSGVIDKAIEDLNEGGVLGIVDFNSSHFGWFKKWMQYNHVEMKNLVDHELLSTLEIEKRSLKNAYFGLWKYFIFFGRKLPN
ncbi:MAG: class I SAM-dependent methyltransferase [Saprospirales bacterium]|nr:MAG: class I SAM-dependent methyltransferase [Saprospirales bacterium]